MGISRSWVADHLVCGVMLGNKRPSLYGKSFGVGQRHEPEVADEPLTVKLVQIAWLDVSVRDVEVALELPEGVGDVRHCAHNSRESRAPQSVGDGCCDRHGEPRLVVL